MLQLIDDSDPGAVTAARALREQLQASPREVSSLELQVAIDHDHVNTFVSQQPPQAVVVWSDTPVNQALLAAIATQGNSPIILLSSVCPVPQQLPLALHDQVFKIQPTATSQTPPRGEQRMRAWLHSRNIRPVDITIALNSYFAATITATPLKCCAVTFHGNT